MCLPCLLTRHNLLTVGFVPTMHWWHWRRSNRMCHFSLRKVGRRVPIVTSWHRDIVTRGRRGILLGEFWIVSAESRFRSLNCASLICYASSMTSCTETSHGPAPSCFTNGLVICYDVLKWHGYACIWLYMHKVHRKRPRTDPGPGYSLCIGLCKCKALNLSSQPHGTATRFGR